MSRQTISLGYIEKNVPSERDIYQKDKFINLTEELKSFIALNILSFNGALSGLRQFLETKSHLKMMKNAYYFA